MFYFVEYMRAKRAIRVIAIILGVLLVIFGIGRIWIMHYQSPEGLAAVFENAPGAHVTRVTLADGTKETVVDDPVQRMHAVIDRKGRTLKIDYTEPEALYRTQRHSVVTMDNDHESYNMKGGMTHGTYEVNRDDTFDLTVVFQLSIIIGLIAATLLAAPLTKENDGHLELTWTKPVSRTEYATASIAIDIAAILLSQVLTLITAFLGFLMFAIPVLRVSSVPIILIALLGPIVWYTLLTTIGASVKRGPGLVIGLSWVGSIIILSVAKGSENATTFWGQTLHVVTQAIAYLDPMAYVTTHNGQFSPNGAVQTIPECIAALLVLAVLYIVTAVLQWRRVEA